MEPSGIMSSYKSCLVLPIRGEALNHIPACQSAPLNNSIIEKVRAALVGVLETDRGEDKKGDA